MRYISMQLIFSYRLKHFRKCKTNNIFEEKYFNEKKIKYKIIIINVLLFL